MDEPGVILVGVAYKDAQHPWLSCRDAFGNNRPAAVHRELRAEIKDNGRAAVRCDLHRIAAELMSSPDYIDLHITSRLTICRRRSASAVRSRALCAVWHDTIRHAPE